MNVQLDASHPIVEVLDVSKCLRVAGELVAHQIGVVGAMDIVLCERSVHVLIAGVLFGIDDRVRLRKDKLAERMKAYFIVYESCLANVICNLVRLDTLLLPQEHFEIGLIHQRLHAFLQYALNLLFGDSRTVLAEQRY